MRKEQPGDPWDFGPYWTHYVRPFGECWPGDVAVPIGGEGGVKVCLKRQYVATRQGIPEKYLPPKSEQTEAFVQKDTLLENAKKGKTINGLYKSYNLYYPSAEFQNRPFNPWPEGGMDRREMISKDYIKVPIRYNTTGFDNMRQISGQEFAYGWEVVPNPPPVNFDVTRLHSSILRGDERNELWYTTPPSNKKDFYHTHQVKGNYPKYNKPANIRAGQRQFIEGD